jgi:superfamily II DNA or RNA helicase
VDEAHVLSSKQSDEVSKIKYNSKFTIFLTGTIDIATMTSYKSLFDMNIIVKYTTEQAIKDDILANYQITIHKVPLNTSIYKKNAKGKMVNEAIAYKNYTYVIDLFKKTGKNFMNLAIKRNQLAQKSINRIEYTKSLIHKINGRLIVFCGYEDNAKKINLPYESSKTGKGNIQRFNDRDIDKLALLQMGKMGITYNALDSLILSAWDGNEATLAQIVSRAVLLDYGGKIADIHIISSNEEPELKKLRNVLTQFPSNKIK